MPLADRNIIITPNRGASSEPQIRFTGADTATSATITLKMYNSSTIGQLSIEGNAGQLFSITDSLVGSIFSVNDVSGIPSMEVFDTGEIRFAQFGGFVDILSTTQSTTTATGALQIVGGVGIGGNINVGGSTSYFAGNVGIGASPSATRGNLQVIQSGISGGNPASSGSTDANQFAAIGNTNVSLRFGFYAPGGCWIQNSAISNYATNYDLVLQPNGGNVGIGKTPTAGYICDVQGYVRSNGGDFAAVYINSTNSGGKAWRLLGGSTSGTSGDLLIENTTDSVTAIRMTPTGNVGIGTTSPAAKLDIAHDGASTFGVVARLNQTAVGNSDGPKIQFRKTFSVGSKSWGVGILNGVDVSTFTINEDTTHDGGFGTSRMAITAGGNVGIGTTSPTQGKLVISAPDNGTSSAISIRQSNAITYGFDFALDQGVNGNGFLYGVFNDTKYEVMQWERTGNAYFTYNVGIGAAPTKRFDIDIGNAQNGIRIISTAAGSGATPVFEGIGYRADGNATFQTRFAGALRRSDGTAIGSGQALGALLFGGQHGTDTTYQSAKVLYPASIVGIAEGSFSNATSMATGISFRTGSTGDDVYSVNLTYGTERMRITSSGNVEFKNGITETVFTITDGAAVDINPTNGTIQLWTLGASRTPTASSFAAGQSVTLMILDGTAYTITWTTIGVTWVGGTAPTLDTTKYTVINLWKVSTTVYGALVGYA